MKILVPVKRVVDYNVKVRVKSDQSGVELENVKMSMNPFDEIAIEEALRIKEKNIASEVIAISIGNTQVQETIRNALAMGADSGIFVNADNNLEPLSIAKILSSVVNKINPDIIIMGKQAIVAGMDAGLMYNTYPLMNGKFFPDQYGELGYLDPFENPGSAQFHHRHLGLITLLSLIFFYIKNFFQIKVKKRLNFLLLITFLQFFLGVFILINFVPTVFASLHQVGALIMFLTIISILHTQNIK